MQTTITNAPFLGRGYVNPGAMTLDATDNGTSVTLAFAVTPFTPAWLVIGKEYAPVNLQQDAREYPGQSVACVPRPDGQAEFLPACASDTWDSVIYFKNDPAGVHVVTIPYNEFMLAAKGCAFQTDGVERTYDAELTNGNGTEKCKVLFKFTTPNIPGWNYPGATPPPTAPGENPPAHGKGGKNK